VVADSGARLLHLAAHPHRTAFRVAEADGPELLRLVHHRIAAGVSSHLGAA
jgi:hypothetical protein